MGNVQAAANTSVNNNETTVTIATNKGVKKKRKAKRKENKSFRRSIRYSRRTRLTSSTVDTRAIKVSRASVRPHVSSGTVWEDPCFPREMAMEGSRMEGMQCRWLRPKEFCESPTLVNKKPSRHDVLQGTIGNCWMMATLAGIADYLPHLLHIVAGVNYDPRSSDYDGVFHCRFWHFGQWVDIYVDDCLPVRRDPGAPKGFSLLGARSPDKNVLWVALVEKALAKFHGSYRAIEAREREYGWRLLTGGVPCILDQEKIRRTPSDDLYLRIKSSLEKGSVVTCSYAISGGRLHAYTVTGADKHSSKGNVIRLRNPWGEEKSQITWLEPPDRWRYTEEEDEEDFRCEDGEFWVMRGECFSKFSQFCIGCFKAEYYDKAKKESTILGHKYSYYGEWRGTSAAGSAEVRRFQNPKYKVKVSGSKNRKVMFELIPRPIESNKGISMFLYKIHRLKQHKATLCEEMRDEGCSPVFLANGCPQFTFELPPGDYMAVVATLDQEDEREFCLRVFAKSSIQCQEISGTFFVTNKSEFPQKVDDKPVKYQYYPGVWSESCYINEDTVSGSLGKITQYHIKPTAPVKLLIRLYQELTSTDQYMRVEMLKTNENLKHAMDQTFKNEHSPSHHMPPTRVQGSRYVTECTLEPGTTYVLLVYPWKAQTARRYVLALAWDAKTNCQIKPFNC